MTPRDWHRMMATSWKGTNVLRLSWKDPSEFMSDGSLHTSLWTRERTVIVSYTWGHEGTRHEGILVVAVNEKSDEATAGWVDSWHHSGAVMLLRGTLDVHGVLDVRGTYPAPPDPDWGWRIVLKNPTPDSLTMTMYNITPKGEEDLAVEARYELEKR